MADNKQQLEKIKISDLVVTREVDDTVKVVQDFYPSVDEEGIKIATISASGTTTELYAPAQSQKGSIVDVIPAPGGNKTIATITVDGATKAIKTVDYGNEINDIKNTIDTKLDKTGIVVDTSYAEKFDKKQIVASITIDGVNSNISVPTKTTVSVLPTLQHGKDIAKVYVDGKQTAIIKAPDAPKIDPIIKSGIKLAEITNYDGVPVELYAPAFPEIGPKVVNVIPDDKFKNDVRIATIQVDDKITEIKTKSYDAHINTINSKLKQKLDIDAVNVTPNPAYAEKGALVATVQVDKQTTKIYAPNKTAVVVNPYVSEGTTIASMTVDDNDPIYLKIPPAKEKFTLADIEFAEDFTFEGNYTLGLKKPTVDKTYTLRAGSTLQDFFNDFFSGKKPEPKITNPSLELVNCTNGTFDAGTKITPSYSFNWNNGLYPFGPDDTNVKLTLDVKLNDTILHDLNGDFPEFEVKAGTTYQILATASHSDGVYAYYDDGTPSTKRIDGKTIFTNKVIGTIIGKAPVYSGQYADVIDNDWCRAENIVNNLNATSTIPTEFEVNDGTRPCTIIFAIPANNPNVDRKHVCLKLAAGSYDLDNITTVNINDTDYKVMYKTIENGFTNFQSTTEFIND